MCYQPIFFNVSEKSKAYQSEGAFHSIVNNEMISALWYVAGEKLPLLVERTPPAIGNVTVEWRIEGPQPSLTFVDIPGVLFFSEVQICIYGLFSRIGSKSEFEPCFQTFN